MLNGHAGKRIFRHFLQRGIRPLASMKFAMRGADQYDSL
ncbi:hypothetical protein SAMCFNEI73_pB0172 (plasmid) [Sinorhizobium americanum]|uniref:Uncharacterized protein n=1 Tax=Sinorhizobium americanum TaxID=194963 RepID=A0A1L3LTH2_9HYPH|nr:hypothetical protein SAMCFNEI73_pB0172 [Sinorhizobium americanum]